MSSTIAHDLHAPPRAIDGYLAMLRQDRASTLDSDGADQLIRIEANPSKMGRMIDGLLDSQRLGRAKLDVTEIDTQELE